MPTVLPVNLVDGIVPVAADFMANFQALVAAIDGLGGGSTLGTANQVAGVNGSGTASEYKTVNGTTNQLSVTHAANSLTLALTAVVAVATAIAAGSNPAGTGAVRLANDLWIAARNAANSADVNLLKLDTTGRVMLGPGDATNLRVGGQLRCDLDAATRAVAPVGVDKWAV
jgi:hypothetical protein